MTSAGTCRTRQPGIPLNLPARAHACINRLRATERPVSFCPTSTVKQRTTRLSCRTVRLPQDPRLRPRDLPRGLIEACVQKRFLGSAPRSWDRRLLGTTRRVRQGIQRSTPILRRSPNTGRLQAVCPDVQRESPCATVCCSSIVPDEKFGAVSPRSPSCIVRCTTMMVNLIWAHFIALRSWKDRKSPFVPVAGLPPVKN